MNTTGKDRQKVAAIVLAAGQGKRMGTAVQKQFLELSGRPVLFYTLQAFEESVVDEVVLVTGSDMAEYCRNEIVDRYGFGKVSRITAGGQERYHSVLNGLRSLSETKPDIVMIHDGARCFVTPELIDDLCRETMLYPACVTATRVKDTIKVADEEGMCLDTPNRDRLWAVQTPQSFSYELILSAYEKLAKAEQQLLSEGVKITDDAQVCELFSETKVKLIPGDDLNTKLTTPSDLAIAERILEVIQSKSSKN